MLVLLTRAKAFPKTVRLGSATEFQAVYLRGAKRTSRSFAVFALENGREYSRFGFTTPRRLGKAHDRNRIKRRVREIIRTSLELIPRGFDFVVNPRRSANERPMTEVRSELLSLLGVTV